MKTVLILGCPSAAVIGADLIEAGLPVVAVRPIGGAAARAVESIPALAALSPADLEIAADQRVLGVFADPVGLCPELAPHPAVTTIRAGGGGVPVDPVAQAVLSRTPCRVSINGRSLEVDTTGRTATEIAHRIAAAVTGLPSAPAARTSTPFAATTAGTLDWPESWDEIDWTAPATAVADLIRATTLPGRAAWTWSEDVRLSVGAAEAEPLTGSAPPGTVLAPDLVATGSGMLRVRGLRDVIGPTELVPGTRLGPPDLASLRHRINDLERALLVLTGKISLL